MTGVKIWCWNQTNKFLKEFSKRTEYSHGDLLFGVDPLNIGRTIFTQGYNIMIYRSQKEIIVGVDDKRFQQR